MDPAAGRVEIFCGAVVWRRIIRREDRIIRKIPIAVYIVYIVVVLFVTEGRVFISYAVIKRAVKTIFAVRLS